MLLFLLYSGRVENRYIKTITIYILDRVADQVYLIKCFCHSPGGFAFYVLTFISFAFKLFLVHPNALHFVLAACCVAHRSISAVLKCAIYIK